VNLDFQLLSGGQIRTRQISTPIPFCKVGEKVALQSSPVFPRQMHGRSARGTPLSVSLTPMSLRRRPMPLAKQGLLADELAFVELHPQP